MPCIQSTNWVWTCNFPDPTDRPVPDFSGDDTVQYAIWSHEKETHDHLQGYLQCTKRRTKNQVLKTFKACVPRSCHVDPQRALNNDEARNYCMKEATHVEGPWEYGSYIAERSHKRKWETILEDPSNEADDPRLYRRAMAAKVSAEQHAYVLENPFPYELRPWQEALMAKLSEEADDRTIYWVYGPDGAEGKSQFAKYLGLNSEWLYVPGGKSADLMYMYCKKPTAHLIVDYPRVAEEFINYSFLEQIKNRVVFSPKYEPIGFHYAPGQCNVHVVVMANFLPQLDNSYDEKGHIVKHKALSDDRVVVLCCKHGAFGCLDCT
ncbi:Rep [Pittosporum tobira alphasatellite 2]|nr:Rep [Pittosporum tobira alphasatellite 2]